MKSRRKWWMMCNGSATKLVIFSRMVYSGNLLILSLSSSFLPDDRRQNFASNEHCLMVCGAAHGAFSCSFRWCDLFLVGFLRRVLPHFHHLYVRLKFWMICKLKRNTSSLVDASLNTEPVCISFQFPVACSCLSFFWFRFMSHCHLLHTYPIKAFPFWMPFVYFQCLINNFLPFLFLFKKFFSFFYFFRLYRVTPIKCQ